MEGGKKMKTAVVYCRVSTEDQEKEGTSLQTQLEAALKYCEDKSYEVRYRFSEAYSGLALERPKLNELRELVRNEQIDVVVVYCLDRLSRNATHGVILRDELDKHHVTLESVTEDIDKTLLGEAITYLRGTFSQIEAEKIRERTMRGKKARAKEGRIPSGSGSTLYGYDYIPVSQKNGGRRVENKTESKWVKQAFEWLVYEGLSTNEILYRLRAHSAPTKSGKPWNRRSVQAILKNPAYTGKTFVFTTAKGGKQFTRPKEDWIEIQGVTPHIISQEMYDAGQVQLEVNQAKAPRNNTVHEYLLRSRLRCRQCGRAYVGGTGSGGLRNGKRYIQRCYRCMGKLKMYAPFERCRNKSWSAKKLESLVWAKLEEYLSRPELIISEIERQRHDAGELGVFETQLQRISQTKSRSISFRFL